MVDPPAIADGTRGSARCRDVSRRRRSRRGRASGQKPSIFFRNCCAMNPASMPTPGCVSVPSPSAAAETSWRSTPIGASPRFGRRMPKRTSGTATALWRLRRLDEAWQQGELASSLAGDEDVRVRGSAHELLAGSRSDAGMRQPPDRSGAGAETDKSRPVMPTSSRRRLLQDQRRWDDALDSTSSGRRRTSEKSKGRPFADLHFFTAETPCATRTHTRRPNTTISRSFAAFH